MLSQASCNGTFDNPHKTMNYDKLQRNARSSAENAARAIPNAGHYWPMLALIFRRTHAPSRCISARNVRRSSFTPLVSINILQGLSPTWPQGADILTFIDIPYKTRFQYGRVAEFLTTQWGHIKHRFISNLNKTFLKPPTVLFASWYKKRGKYFDWFLLIKQWKIRKKITKTIYILSLVSQELIFIL